MGEIGNSRIVYRLSMNSNMRMTEYRLRFVFPTRFLVFRNIFVVL